MKVGLVSKAGSWYSIGDERIGQGKESAKQYLRDHPDVADKIEQQIRQIAKEEPRLFYGKGAGKKAAAKAIIDNAKPAVTSTAKAVDIDADELEDDDL